MIELASPRMIMRLSARHEWRSNRLVRNDNDAGCMPKPAQRAPLHHSMDLRFEFGEGGSDVSLRGHEKNGGAQIITHRIVILDVISADLAGGDNWNMNWDEK